MQYEFGIRHNDRETYDLKINLRLYITKYFSKFKINDIILNILCNFKICDFYQFTVYKKKNKLNVNKHTKWIIKTLVFVHVSVLCWRIFVIRETCFIKND